MDSKYPSSENVALIRPLEGSLEGHKPARNRSDNRLGCLELKTISAVFEPQTIEQGYAFGHIKSG